MTQVGAKTLFNRLLHHNFKYVFGYPGGAILPVLNEFYAQKKIKYVLSRTEQGGSFMAEGYAKATGTPAVVMVTSGPGAINIMTSMQNALSDGTPILALTGQVSTAVLGTDAFQEADIIGISKPCTKWNSMITSSENISQTVDLAMKKMMHKRYGPVLIDLPKNVMSLPTGEEKITTILDETKQESKIKGSIKISPQEINKLIFNAERPVILAGQGVIQSNAINEIRCLAETYRIPVTTTLLGLGVMNENHYLSLKMVGMHGSYYANKAIQNCDLLLNFGSRFDDRIIGNPKLFAPKAKIIHVDIEERNINKTIQSHYYINDSCKTVLNEMSDNNLDSDLIKASRNHYWLNQIDEWKKNDFKYPNKPVLQGRKVIDVLNSIIHSRKENFTIVADVGAHQMWAAQFIDYNYPKVKFITSGGLGSMGYAVPASIGVKLGLENDTVICICGDGGFTMSFVEVITAVKNKINVKILIINNNYQMMVKMWQDKFYNKQFIGVKMDNPPFEKVCREMGCKTMKISTSKTATLEKKLKEFLDYEDGPIIANVITDENESVLPMVSPGKSLDDMILEEDNTGLSGDAPC
jgi:acetolactate synthase-1/2/3 large subunit